MRTLSARCLRKETRGGAAAASRRKSTFVTNRAGELSHVWRRAALASLHKRSTPRGMTNDVRAALRIW